MNEYASVRNQRCPNRLCKFYGKLFDGNVVMHSARRRRLKCKACLRTWVSHREESHYRLKTPLDSLQRAMALLLHGWSVRKTAKALRVSPSTVQRWKEKFKNFNS